jgi:histidine triad (HIT) family protein
MKECVFCKIVEGRHEAPLVYEDAETLAFLDHRPLFFGHTLVIPRRHVETLADLPAELIPAVFSSAQLVARAIESGLGAGGTFVAINNRVSQSVPHLHVHVVPRNPKDGLRGFFWPRTRYDSPETLRRVQEALRNAIAELRLHQGTGRSGN